MNLVIRPYDASIHIKSARWVVISNRHFQQLQAAFAFLYRSRRLLFSFLSLTEIDKLENVPSACSLLSAVAARRV